MLLAGAPSNLIARPAFAETEVIRLSAKRGQLGETVTIVEKKPEENIARHVYLYDLQFASCNNCYDGADSENMISNSVIRDHFAAVKRWTDDDPASYYGSG